MLHLYWAVAQFFFLIPGASIGPHLPQSPAQAVLFALVGVVALLPFARRYFSEASMAAINTRKEAIGATIIDAA